MEQLGQRVENDANQLVPSGTSVKGWSVCCFLATTAVRIVTANTCIERVVKKAESMVRGLRRACPSGERDDRETWV
eukprot:11201900-Lingulodinium_polyedra.AAC.1